MDNFLQTLGLYQDGFLTAAKGIGTTLYVTAGGLIIGILLGLLMALGKLSKHRIFRYIANIFIEVVRGTPLFVQVLILAFGSPMLISAFLTLITGEAHQFTWQHMAVVGVIACGINSGAYQAEIIRSGINAVNKGQREASRSLGMSEFQTMKFIILPQAFKIILPALANEFVTLIKETSILSYIGIVEITRQGQLLQAHTFEPFPAFIGVALVYMCMTIPLSRAVAYMEVKMGEGVGAKGRKRRLNKKLAVKK